MTRYSKIDSLIEFKIEKLLSEYSETKIAASDVYTLITREVYYRLISEKMHNKILTGHKYKYKHMSFDIITRVENKSSLEQLIKEGNSAIIIFDRNNIKNPQRHSLSLNKKYPELKKIMLVQQNEYPGLFTLLEREKSYKSLFVPASYKVLE